MIKKDTEAGKPTRRRITYNVRRGGSRRVDPKAPSSAPKQEGKTDAGQS
jgi:hypothetical protein